MKAKSRQSATKLLLLLLARTSETAIDFFAFINELHSHHRAFLLVGREYGREMKRLEDARFAKLTLKRLRERNYLRVQKIGQQLMVTLTTKGLQTTLTAKLKQTKPRTDGFVTIVIFDIPQSQNTVRRQFRWLLRQGGFIKLQQSVWMSRGDTYQLIVNFVKQAQLQPWVNVFQAKNFFQLPKC